MGMAKRILEEIEKRGYGNSDKTICHECVGDYALKNYIKENGTMGVCGYCKKSRKCILLEDLMQPIMRGIFSEYEDAVNCMGWDSAEGGFLGTTFDNFELVHDELFDELNIDDESILDDIADLLNESFTWCYRDPYGDREDDATYYSWRSFAQLVKESTRYVFYKLPSDDESRISSSPANILEIIGGYVEMLNLIITLNPQTKKIFRGRTHKEGVLLSGAEDFTCPPLEKAKANRMSPEGISMFYGAFDEATALTEIYNNADECAAVAEFKLLRPLKVLDLTKPNWLKMPSLFDDERRKRRSPLLFLRKFAEDISRKCIADNSIEYVPTQIITEYFRHVFRTATGERLDGIVYCSALNPGGKCVVLFIKRSDCIGKDGGGKGILYLHMIKHYRKVFQLIDEE